MATSNGMLALPAALPPAQDATTIPAANTPATDARSGMLSDWYDSYMKSAPKTTAATAAQAGTTAWAPGKDATVQGQLTNVLDAGGPLEDRATTKAAQMMNGRGLLNSSMAVTAGQSALYDAALPIAQQDATTHAAAGQFNANASNTASLTNAGLATDVSKVNAGAENAATAAQSTAGVGSFQQQQGIAGQQALQATDQSFSAAQRGLDRQFTTEEREAMQGYETQRLSTQNAFQERLQTLQESGMDKRQAEQLALQESMAKMGEMGVQNRFDAQQALQSSQFSMEQLAIDRRIVAQHQNELERIGVQAKLTRDDVPTAYAANVSANTMATVNAIMADPNLSAEPGTNGALSPKMNAIQNVVDFANSTLDWASKFYGTAFPPIAMPGSSAPGSMGPQRPGNSTTDGIAPDQQPRWRKPGVPGFNERWS